MYYKRYFGLTVTFLYLLSFFTNSPQIPLQQAGFSLNLIGGLVKVKPDKNKSYHELKLTSDDQENITFIITSLGEQNKLWLLVHKGELNEKGDKIQGVHPLKFLVVIFKDRYLKKVCMPTIMSDFFKKKNLIEGLGANMTKETQKGKLQKYLKDFMKEINLHEKHFSNLMKYVEVHDWEGFVNYIVNN